MHMAAVFLAVWTRFVLPMKLNEEGELWTRNGGIILVALA